VQVQVQALEQEPARLQALALVREEVVELRHHRNQEPQ